MLTEKARYFKIQNTIAPQTLTDGDVNGSGIDLKGFNDAFFVVSVGANGGTLDGSNNVTFALQDSDDNSTYAAVTESGLAGGFTVNGTTGVFATVDAGADAAQTYKVAYTGNKRYVRLVADVTGTISLPVGAVSLLGSGIVPQT